MYSHSAAWIDVLRLRSFLERRYGGRVKDWQIRISPLRGGLTSRVCRVSVHATVGSGHPAFVVKRTEGEQRREVAAYQTYLVQSELRLAPRLFGAQAAGPNACYLYLEWVPARQRWPWRDDEVAGLVLDQLARVHAELPAARFSKPLSDWDYETELSDSAATTVAAFQQASRLAGLAAARNRRRALERVAAALPAMRRQLLGAGLAVLHGDAHPGNAIIRVQGAANQPVLLDWGRLRLGSPLEDVASWLHSLGFWELEVRRRHDTLLQRYRAAQGLSTALTPGFRELCWLAGASNALAGALRYHLHVAASAATEHLRFKAVKAARDWLRVIRRADACWRC